MNPPSTKPVSYQSDVFFAIVKNSFKFRLFLLKNLPSAYFAGLRVVEANDLQCTVSVPFKWFTRNPFRSTYFACLGMAAEMTTGILAMSHIYKRKPGVSMLVVGSESRFHRKATGLTKFRCDDGWHIRRCIDEAIATGEPRTVTVTSTGRDQKGELIAEFVFTWSFKKRSE
jgi:hypothetical protein